MPSVPPPSLSPPAPTIIYQPGTNVDTPRSANIQRQTSMVNGMTLKVLRVLCPMPSVLSASTIMSCLVNRDFLLGNGHKWHHGCPAVHSLTSEDNSVPHVCCASSDLSGGPQARHVPRSQQGRLFSSAHFSSASYCGDIIVSSLPLITVWDVQCCCK